MDEILKMYEKLDKKPIKSITPTRYQIPTQSIYGTYLKTIIVIPAVLAQSFSRKTIGKITWETNDSKVKVCSVF